jgi:rubrerythrin
VGKFATYRRAGITMSKEKALSPLETKKADIENQLIEIEKQINRLNYIKIDEEGNEDLQVLRCSYCGRRVNPGEVCPGCGSDKTTYELN